MTLELLFNAVLCMDEWIEKKFTIQSLGNDEISVSRMGI